MNTVYIIGVTAGVCRLNQRSHDRIIRLEGEPGRAAFSVPLSTYLSFQLLEIDPLHALCRQ